MFSGQPGGCVSESNAFSRGILCRDLRRSPLRIGPSP
jgi:hypothetical protein